MYEVIGALAAPIGKAPFDRAPLIVKSTSAVNGDDDLILQVARYREDKEDFLGNTLTRGDFNVLVASEQAIELPATPHEHGTWLWTFRIGSLYFSRTMGFEARCVRIPAQEDCTRYVIVKESLRTDAFRDYLASEARISFLDMYCAGYPGHHVSMLDLARRAFTYEREMSPVAVAIMSLAYEESDPARASGYVKMAQNSKGAVFADKVLEEKARIFKLRKT
jgi:hypothetical protein